MNLRSMTRQEAATYHFVPQAILKRPPSFFMSRGVSFHKGHDDLDEFEVAELSLDDKIPFAVLRYRGNPEDETTVFLPSRFPLSEIPGLVDYIITAFNLSVSTVTWQRTTADRPY